MSKTFIVLGNRTDRGNAAVSVPSMTDINGQPVARHGDKAARATWLSGQQGQFSCGPAAGESPKPCRLERVWAG